MRKSAILILTVISILTFSCESFAQRGERLRKIIQERRAEREAGKTVASPSVAKTINFGGRERSYRIFIPSGTDKNTALPLVFVFHGGGGEGAGTEKLTKFSVLAEREKFVAVYPDGFGKNWNDGREDIGAEAFNQKIDDLGFVKAMFAEISRNQKIDEKRVYSTGISNGGIFSHYLAANWAEKIAAIAPVVGGIADPFYKNFNPKEPVSVFIMQGTADPLTPYDGGDIAKGQRGKIISMDETIRLWAKTNNIKGDPAKGNLPDADTADGCKVETYLWSGGKNGTEIKLYKQIGGGHTWPGGGQYAPKIIIGGVCRDFDATSEIWQFFKAHPKR